MSWDYAAILVLLGIVVPLLGRRRVRVLLRRRQTSKPERLRLYSSTITSQCAIATLVLWRAIAHGMTFGDLGLAVPRPLLTVLMSAVFSFLMLGNQVLSIRMIAKKPEESAGAMARLALRIFPQDPTERTAFFFVVVTVAICEELIYRGFLQRLFIQLSNGTVAVGVITASAFFSIAHLYQGKRGMVTTYVVGVLFSIIRAWTGSQIPGIVTHFVADLTAGFLLPLKMTAITIGQQTSNDADV